MMEISGAAAYHLGFIPPAEGNAYPIEDASQVHVRIETPLRNQEPPPPVQCKIGILVLSLIPLLISSTTCLPVIRLNAPASQQSLMLWIALGSTVFNFFSQAIFTTRLFACVTTREEQVSALRLHFIACITALFVVAFFMLAMDQSSTSLKL